MKKLLLFVSLAITGNMQTNAQAVNEYVNFDFYQNASNNDLNNHFSGGLGLSQIQTNGITGGCLQTPDSISWGNDNAIYCSKYKPTLGDTLFTSICFRFDSTHVGTNNFHRAMSIWLNPYADWNHYIVATVSGNKKMEIISYGWVNTPYPNLTLYNDHWYRYRLIVVMVGGPLNQVYVKGEVYELGLTGTNAPSLINSSSGTLNDSILVADTAIQVSVSGTLYGGATYLDDFHFHGIPGASNCINVGAGISDYFSLQDIHIYPSLVSNILNVECNDQGTKMMEISITDMQGNKLIGLKTRKPRNEIDISELANGVYIVCCYTDCQVKNMKILVSR